jgi:hypothetical protein
LTWASAVAFTSFCETARNGAIGPSRGSKYGIEEFLEVKYLCMGGIDR